MTGNTEKIAAGETVSMPYSFAIRSDAYTGYYPLKFEITYRETATGDLQKIEEEFWVHVKNKEKETILRISMRMTVPRPVL